MKNIATILLLFCSTSLFAQQGKQAVSKDTNPMWCLLPQLDSIKVDLNKTYLDYQNIDNIYVLKDPDQATLRRYKHLAGYIMFKNKPELVSLDALKAKKDENRFRVNFVINGVLVEDTTRVKIELTAIKKVEYLYTIKNDPSNVSYLITLKRERPSF